MEDDGEGEDGGQEDGLEEVWRTRCCWRKKVSDIDFGRRGLSGIGPWWRMEAQEAVLVVVASAAAKALPLPLLPLLLVLLLRVTHLKAERRPARGYIQDKENGKWDGSRVTSSAGTRGRPRTREELQICEFAITKVVMGGGSEFGPPVVRIYSRNAASKPSVQFHDGPTGGGRDASGRAQVEATATVNPLCASSVSSL